MSGTVSADVFVETLSDRLSPEEAQETIERAAEHKSLAVRDQYGQDEALELADALTELDDVKLFVNISGNTIKARIESGKF
jgi:ATP:corrinoid adenosyltransferase